MTEIPYKFYKIGDTIEILPGTNTPYGSTEATQQDFLSYYQANKARLDDYYARNDTPGLRDAFNAIISGGTPGAAAYSGPVTATNSNGIYSTPQAAGYAASNPTSQTPYSTVPGTGQADTTKALNTYLTNTGQPNIVNQPPTQQIPGVGTLTTIPKTPTGATPTATDPNLAGLYSRTGVTPPPNLTFTPSQATNANNTVYKDANNNVFKLDGTPIDLKTFKSMGLNIDHINTLSAIKGSSGGQNGAPGAPVFGGTSPISAAYAALNAELDRLSQALQSSQIPGAEERDLQQKLAAAKAALASFDTETLARAESYSGQGRGATTNYVAGNVAKDARTRALQRLGMAQDAQTLVDQLTLDQNQRKALGDAAQTAYNIAKEKLDIALGIQKEVTDLSDKKADDARKFLLDVVDFSKGKTWEQLDPQTQAQIISATADSPITLGMVKQALYNAVHPIKTGTDRSSDSALFDSVMQEAINQGLTPQEAVFEAQNYAKGTGISIPYAQLTTLLARATAMKPMTTQETPSSGGFLSSLNSAVKSTASWFDAFSWFK